MSEQKTPRCMIRLDRVSKTFSGADKSVHAVREVSLEIPEGDIFGIVGFSGAGKSTLVRCMNLLERPTSGTVIVNGTDLTKLSSARINEERQKIGMIFQQFNLFATRTVFDNVAFPLRGSGMKREEIRKKVLSLLDYVELRDKEKVYPSQLSGGQKQRVAIARALATDPRVLLCDEATSALDPITTSSILALLKRLNRETGITMVIITHQMQVVKELCRHVAVMEKGTVVEQGDVFQIFAWPKEQVTRSFVDSAGGLLPEKQEIRSAPGETVLQLKFYGKSANDAVVSQASRRFGLDLNILSGNIETVDDRPLGKMTVGVSGSEEQLNGLLEYLKEIKVDAEVIKHADLAE